MPWPSALPREFIPISRATGPLTTTAGAESHVVASSPCALNSVVHAASTAASTTGRYSGRHPASTALTATFSTVTGTRLGGTTATTSPGSRAVPSSIRSTRACVGATTGSPSDQPRPWRASASSCSAVSSTVRECSDAPRVRTSSSSARSGSIVRDPQPGRCSGRSGPSPSTPVSSSHAGRDQPGVRATSAPPANRTSVGTVSMPDARLTSSAVSSRAFAGDVGSSWE